MSLRTTCLAVLLLAGVASAAGALDLASGDLLLLEPTGARLHVLRESPPGTWTRTEVWSGPIPNQTPARARPFVNERFEPSFVLDEPLSGLDEQLFAVRRIGAAQRFGPPLAFLHPGSGHLAPDGDHAWVVATGAHPDLCPSAWHIALADGTSQSVCAGPPPLNALSAQVVTATAQERDGDLLVASHGVDNQGWFDPVLWRIDADDVTSQLAAALPGRVAALVVLPSGRVFGTNPDVARALVEIDPVLGSWTQTILPVDFEPESLGFDPKRGVMVAATTSTLVLIDPADPGQPRVETIPAVATDVLYLAGVPAGPRWHAGDVVAALSSDGPGVFDGVTGAFTDLGAAPVGEDFGVATLGRDAFVSSLEDDEVFRVDLLSGARTLLSQGGWLSGTRDLAMRDDGILEVANEEAGPGTIQGIIRIDPATGQQLSYSASAPPALVRPTGLTPAYLSDEVTGHIWLDSALGFVPLGPTPGLSSPIAIAERPAGDALAVTDLGVAVGTIDLTVGWGLGYAAIGQFDAQGIAWDVYDRIVFYEQWGDTMQVVVGGQASTLASGVGSDVWSLAALERPVFWPDCANGIDDDGDGQTDLADPGCDDAEDGSERSAARACDDGLDNDGDGRGDWPTDPGCASAASATESPQCQDGIDNDGATGTDFDGAASVNGGVPLDLPDPQCASFSDNREAPASGGSCGLGPELPLVLAMLGLSGRARRSRVRISSR